MQLQTILDNFLQAPVLFFFLGMVGVFVRTDLEIPAPIAKFLSIYLLFSIGFKGGVELNHSGFSTETVLIMSVCVLGSFLVPFVCYPILRKKLDVYNSGAIAATFGSISAVTFATATSFLEHSNIPFSGYMVASMALMESPAIIAGLMLIRSEKRKLEPISIVGEQQSFKHILIESVTNGSVFLLLGSLVIGTLTGSSGMKQLNPFVSDIYKGVLCFYMLDMGLLAGRRINELRTSGWYLISFAAIYPLVMGSLAMIAAYMLGLSVGNALLFTILFASASYIAVPAAMRIAVPQANMSLLLPMALGVTFTFNIALGIPLFYSIIEFFWK